MTHKYQTFEQIVDQIAEEIQALPDRRRLVKELPKLTASVTKLIRDSAGLHLTRARNQEASIHKGAMLNPDLIKYNKKYSERKQSSKKQKGSNPAHYIYEVLSRPPNFKVPSYDYTY